MQKSCSWSQSRDFPVSVLVSTKFVSSYSDCYESQVYRIVLCHKRLIKSLKGHESLGMILNVEIKGVSVSEWVSEWVSDWFIVSDFLYLPAIVDPSGPKWYQVDPGGPKWTQVIPSGPSLVVKFSWELKLLKSSKIFLFWIFSRLLLAQG